MSTWADLFSPVMAARNLSVRSQQETMGNAIIDAFDSRTNLVVQALVGTGKSFGVLIPMIDKILTSKKTSTPLRGVVSTETLSLQDQYFLTDLPFLSKMYPGFTYRTLKGRSNYICLNMAKQMSRGNTQVAGIVKKIEQHMTRLGAGERRDLDKILGSEISDHLWSFVAGSSINCGESQCTSSDCFSTKARAEALSADLVVVNHALLRVDAETRDDPLGESFLGPVDLLAVDEAHTLESVLISGWTEELSEWELLDKTSKIFDGVEFASTLVNDATIGFQTRHANEGVADYLKAVTRFFKLRNRDQDWKFVTDSISLKFISSGDPSLASAMSQYEEEGLAGLEFALRAYEDVIKFLKKASDVLADSGGKGRRKISKARTAARDLISIISKIISAMGTKDGLFLDFGVPYVVTATGVEKRNGDDSVRLSVVPLDISQKAKMIWEDRSCVLMSGTLMDLTENSFRYATTSLGLTDYKEISTDSPFKHDTQQLVYVTDGTRQKVDVNGAQFAMDELLELITAANGRSLVLFTSRAELDYVAAHVRQLVASGVFPWRVLVQDKDANKSTLKESFEKDVHSVLFATKSFFVGSDFAGETLSLVVMCKFPLPQFNVVCRQQIAWWRSRGFPNWYERESLAVFHQAAGRLIRTSTDTGVVALLDQRVADSSEKVCQTALLGVKSLGSPVTREISIVKAYLA